MVRERLLVLPGADVGDVEVVLEALGPADDDTVADLERSPRHRRLLDDLDAFAAEPPWTPLADQDSRPFLRRRIRNEWNRVAERMAAVSDAGRDDSDEDQLHEARKAAKRLRYALEVAELEWPKKPTRLRKSVHGLTDVLGELQDSAVTRAALRELAGRPGVSEEAVAAAGTARKARRGAGLGAGGGARHCLVGRRAEPPGTGREDPGCPGPGRAPPARARDAPEGDGRVGDQPAVRAAAAAPSTVVRWR